MLQDDEGRPESLTPQGHRTISQDEIKDHYLVVTKTGALGKVPSTNHQTTRRAFKAAHEKAV